MTFSFKRFLDHTQRRTTVGILWKSDQLVAETSTWQKKKDIHAPGGIRTHNLNKRAAADLRVRRRVHGDRH